MSRHFIVSELNGTFVEGYAGLNASSLREVSVIDGHGEAHAVSNHAGCNFFQLGRSLIAVTDLLVLEELKNLVGAEDQSKRCRIVGASVLRHDIKLGKLSAELHELVVRHALVSTSSASSEVIVHGDGVGGVESRVAHNAISGNFDSVTKETTILASFTDNDLVHVTGSFGLLVSNRYGDLTLTSAKLLLSNPVEDEG